MQRNVIFMEELQRSKDTCLDLSLGIVRTSVLPSLWKVSPMPSPYLLLDSCKAREMPPVHSAAVTCRLSSHPSTGNPALPCAHCMNISKRMLLPTMVARAASFPVTESFQNPSFRKHVLFLAANVPKVFFYPFQLAAMYHSKSHIHHLHRHTE